MEVALSQVNGRPWVGQAALRYLDNQGSPVEVREEVTDKQRKDIRWYIEEFMYLPEGGNLVSAARVEDLLQSYGLYLGRLLQAPPLQQWGEAVRQAGEGRLLLRVEKPGDEAAFSTPWELLRLDADGKYLHELGVTVVRRVRANVPPPALPDTSSGLRVLVVICRPDDAGFLDPRYTPEAILNALQDRPEVTVDFCRPATREALFRQLFHAREQGRPYHIVHFDGHGTILPTEGGMGALCFEDAKGKMDLVRADRMGHLLAEFQIPLVVLEACRSADNAFAEATVAGELARQGVGTVLAMGYAVHVDLTRTLMAGFYEGIAQGRTVSAALGLARTQAAAQRRRRVGVGPDAPGVELCDWFVPQLYQSGDDPVLLPNKPATATPRAVVEPMKFPPAPRAGFQGRGYELHRLERAVLGSRSVVVFAPGGMGKTALVREAAHWWTRTGFFPDGAVFLSFEDAPSPEAVVSRMGEALEGLDFHKHQHPEQRLTELLARRRMLMVWDNYESVLPAFRGGEATPPDFAALARAWTAGDSRLLITCRDNEVGLESFSSFPLGELSEPEGLLLLVRFLEELKIDRIQREAAGLTADSLKELVRRVGGHPLALELVSPYLRERGLESVLAELGKLLAEAEQQHIEARNRSIWASLNFSIRHLSPAAREALPAVALLAGGALELMAPDVAGLQQDVWPPIRTELERTGLVRVTEPFLQPHPVLAEVQALAPTAEVQERFLDVVGGLCGAFDKLVRSADPMRALMMMAYSEAVIYRAIERAMTTGKLHEAWGMADSLKHYLGLRGRAGEAARLMTRLHHCIQAYGGELTEVSAVMEREAAWARAPRDADGACHALASLLARLESVRTWDTRGVQALTQAILGRIHYGIRRRPADALAPLDQAEVILRELEENGQIGSTNRAAVLGDKANALRSLGRFEEALVAAKQGQALDRERNDGSAIIRGLGLIAYIYNAQGRNHEAREHYLEALKFARDVGDNEAQGILSQYLGNIALRRNHPEEAIAYLREALTAFHCAGNEHGETRVLLSLSDVDRQRGNLEAALEWLEKSLQLATKFGCVEGQASAHSGRGIIFSQQASQASNPTTVRPLLEKAVVEARTALSLCEQLGQPASIAGIHSNLAVFLRQIGALKEAEEHARAALDIRERLNDHEIWKTLGILEEIAAARGDQAAAAEYRLRKEVARVEAETRAGVASLPLEFVASLFQVALLARREGVPLDQALSADGAPEDFLPELEQTMPWLAVQLRALAQGAARPADAVPGPYREIIDAAWQTALTETR